MAGDAKYRVGMVSKMTGLSTHTLRIWEKRYAAVLPKRTDAGADCRCPDRSRTQSGCLVGNTV